MYLVVLTDEHLKIHNAVTFENMIFVRACLCRFGPDRGFSAMVFKLNPKTEIYEEIFPEDMENDN